MKIFLTFVACTLAISSAEEHPRGKMIHLCGAELAKALKRVCEDGVLDLSNLQHIQHHHQHGLHHQWKGQPMKRDTSGSLVEDCCHKPCHVKDFVSYCPHSLDKIEIFQAFDERF